MNGLREKVSENFHEISFGIRTHRKNKCGRRDELQKKVSQRNCYCTEKQKKFRRIVLTGWAMPAAKLSLSVCECGKFRFARSLAPHQVCFIILFFQAGFF